MRAFICNSVLCVLIDHALMGAALASPVLSPYTETIVLGDRRGGCPKGQQMAVKIASQDRWESGCWRVANRRVLIHWSSGFVCVYPVGLAAKAYPFI